MKSYIFSLLALFVFSACSSNPSASTTTYTLQGSIPTGSNVGVYLTDQPAQPQYSHVFVQITGVDIIQAASGDSNPQSPTIANPISIDLLTLRSGKNTLLGALNLPAGTYQQIRLKLASNPSSGDPVNYAQLVGNDTKYALKTPSAAQTGIKITGLNLTVDASGQSAILLDFDAAKSVVKTGNTYLLKPVIQAKVGKVENGKVETTDTGASDPNQE